MNKNNMISKYKEKAFKKIQLLFMIKTLRKVRIDVAYLNIIKVRYVKPIANIIFMLGDEKMMDWTWHLLNEG